MERESFEDERIAGILNEGYIAIKVDREERPDIDHIYMTVCQMLTGSGGWPLTIFMTPDKKPFYAATYIPPDDRYGMLGIDKVLFKIADIWKTRREKLIAVSEEITGVISGDRGGTGTKPSRDADKGEDLREEAFAGLADIFDNYYGGFGIQPKFPTPVNLFFLMRYGHQARNGHTERTRHSEHADQAVEMVMKTLDSMRRGGIFDQIGYGFCRYSTDRRWLAPHFEKMLYDNALLAIAYTEAYQMTDAREYAETARQIIEYILRDMTSEEGAFYSAEDADSEGQEGKFYLWSKDEVIQILGSGSGEKFCKYYGITDKGNFEGRNIPNLIDGTVPADEQQSMEECRKKLFAVREQRVHPFKDNKILTSWNALMIAALSIAGRTFGEKRYTDAAAKAWEFIQNNLVRNDGRLLARYRDGEASYPAYADDYAFLVWGLIELYEAVFNISYIGHAQRLLDEMVSLFWDDAGGGMFFYGKDAEQLIARPKQFHDGAMPSANSVSAFNFIRLARLTGRHELEQKTEAIMKSAMQEMQHSRHSPLSYVYMVSASMYLESGGSNIIVASPPDRKGLDAMLESVRHGFRPFTTTLVIDENAREDIGRIIPMIKDYGYIDDRAAAYVCEGFTCRPPVSDPHALRDIIC